MDKALRTAIKDAVQYKANVYRVGRNTYITSHCEVEGGVLVFTYAGYAYLNQTEGQGL